MSLSRSEFVCMLCIVAILSYGGVSFWKLLLYSNQPPPLRKDFHSPRMQNKNSLGHKILSSGHKILSPGRSKEMVVSAQQADKSLTVDYCLKVCLNGTVTFNPGGRFGNAFMEFSSGWAIAKIYNLTLIIPDETLGILNDAFDGISDSTVGEYLSTRKTPEGIPCEKCVSAKSVKFLNVHREVSPVLVKETLQKGGPLVLGKYITLPGEIIRVLKPLRKTLRFKPEYVRFAQEKLQRIREETASASGVPEDSVIFLGMHVRRTDYIKFVEWRLRSKRLADEAYYSRAVACVHSTLALSSSRPTSIKGEPDPNGTRSRKGDVLPTIAVVITSDDMQWVRNVLKPALAVAVPYVWVYDAGQGTEDTTIYDLALLSSCNHTIIAYGTFGLTAALLSGGQNVLFYFEHDFVVSKQFADLIPEWTILT